VSTFKGAINRYPKIPFTNTFEIRFFISVEYDEIRCGRVVFVSRGTVAAINLETPRFFYCKVFVTLTMLLTYQFRRRQSVECAQR
jgi:hypothetical protein